MLIILRIQYVIPCYCVHCLFWLIVSGRIQGKIHGLKLWEECVILCHYAHCLFWLIASGHRLKLGGKCVIPCHCVHCLFWLTASGKNVAVASPIHTKPVESRSQNVRDATLLCNLQRLMKCLISGYRRRHLRSFWRHSGFPSFWSYLGVNFEVTFESVVMDKSNRGLYYIQGLGVEGIFILSVLFIRKRLAGQFEK